LIIDDFPEPFGPTTTNKYERSGTVVYFCFEAVAARFSMFFIALLLGVAARYVHDDWEPERLSAASKALLPMILFSGICVPLSWMLILAERMGYL
jgi:predicted PurR-regulated permease PerM